MKKFTVIAIAVLLLASIAGCAASKSGGSQNLSKDQCQNIALEHAGLTAEQVTWLRAEYDLDDLQPQYEVEFRHGDYEFDYVIHAKTGEVLSWDKEYESVTKPTAPDDPTTAPPAKTQPTEPSETQPTESSQATPEKLTAEDAKAIALEHAGLTAEQVTRLRAEYDLDDGVPEYSVEFYADGWEYDYEIHAETGKILEWDKEYDVN